jgi:hypothetical protein
MDHFDAHYKINFLGHSIMARLWRDLAGGWRYFGGITASI